MASSSSTVPFRVTETQRQQRELEEKVSAFLQTFAAGSRRQKSFLLELWRDQHVDYLLRGLEHLGPGYCVLDANRPWLCYWILHSLALLGEPIDAELGRRMVNFLSRCQDPQGGYGGGPGQMPHLATTYAAICSLVTIGGNEALASINREKTLEFLLRMKDPSGGFRVHENGEMDVRGCYTAVAVGHILDLLLPPVIDRVGDYIVSCQTHEGGIGGEPGAEAHGGYTYCGLAALVLINQAHLLDLPRLVNWAVFRQGKVEGGFQGRVNKLVDGCYSFWQGGLFPLIQRLTQHLIWQQAVDESSVEDVLTDYAVEFCNTEKVQAESSRTGIARKNNHPKVGGNANAITAERLFPVVGDVGWKHSTSESKEERDTQRKVDKNSFHLNFPEDSPVGPLFNTQALQGYLLLCCQVLEGGLRDKPEKARDYYHTCYCLSGLSTAQYCSSTRLGAPPLPCSVLGPFTNLLEPTHPLCNIVLENYYDARKFYSKHSIYGN